ncbi:MAG: HAD family hydrolase [Anaerolineae bacterium]
MALDVWRIRALCFDVDGTLSDTDDLYVQQMMRFLPLWLFAQPERTARRLVMWLESPGNTLLGLADTLGVDDEAIALLDWLYRHRRRGWKHYLLVPGVVEMLESVHRRYPLAVVSARDEQGTLAFLEHFNLLRHFDVVITALSAAHTKPYPDPVLLAAQKMGVSPADCVMIGDTTVDIRAGKLAGAQTVGVLCGFGTQAELQKQGADLILPSTADLLQVLAPALG